MTTTHQRAKDGAVDLEVAAEAQPVKSKGKKGRQAKPRAGDLTLADLSDRYLAHMAEAGKSPGTMFSYGMELRTAQAELGAETLVAAITPEQVQAFFDSPRVTLLKSGVAKAPPSVAKTRRVLRLALVWAAEQGLIATAPIPEVPQA